tara:strand:+ start:648 stop:1238 length:591 start_codon:yes stop_codon:yes gene_type:complete
MIERIRQLFGLSVENKMAIAEAIGPLIAQASTRLVECLLNDGKILICGNGGSAANGLHFSTALLNHFGVERPSLPAISLMSDITTLTSMVNDNQVDQIFSKQINALGKENDILITISTSGNANNLLHAVQAAHEQGMSNIVLSGREGGIIANHLGPEDIEIRVGLNHAARIREMHLFILHGFCDLIDQSLFGQGLE